MDPARGRMAHGIGDRLLSDAQELVVHLGRPGSVVAGDRRREPDRPVADRLPGEAPERRGEIRGLEHRRPQVPDRLARVSDIRLDLAPHAGELIAGAHRRRPETVGDAVELQGHADQALQQRVVDLAAQSRPLGQRQRELALHQAQAEAPREQRGRGDRHRAQRVEQRRLVERRLDAERPLAPRPSSTCRPRDAPRRGSDTPVARGSCRRPFGAARPRPSRCPHRPDGSGSEDVSAPPASATRSSLPAFACLPAAWPAPAPSAARWRWLPRCARPRATAAP